LNNRRVGLLIGTGVYHHAAELPELDCPPRDAQGLADVLGDERRGGFETHVLLDRPKGEIELEINGALSQLERDDLVLIFYSGHGKLNRRGYLHLATPETDTANLEATSLPVVNLRYFLDSTLARRIVLILDCCYSGRIGDAFLLRSSVGDSLQSTFERTGAGMYIMTASTGIESAIEKQGDEYSVFSGAVIEGLRSGRADIDRDGLIDMEELYRFVRNEVATSSPQAPMRWRLSGVDDIVIARNPAAAVSLEPHATIGVMVLPGDRPGSFRFLVEDRGAWRDLSVFVDELPERATNYMKAATDIVTSAEDPRALATFVHSLSAALLPRGLATMLTSAANEAPEDNPPLLRIHISPGADAIPWELLHDGHDFLGLRFQITRVPILTDESVAVDTLVHPVRRIMSVLGKGVLSDEQFDEWLAGLSGVPAEVEVKAVPSDPRMGPWPDIGTLVEPCDVLHITSHSSQSDAGPSLTLDPATPGKRWRFELTSATVQALRGAGKERALVFANLSLVSDAGWIAGDQQNATSPLATAFLGVGTENFIGACAPLSRTVALRFPAVFYDELLNKRQPIARALWSAKRRFAAAEDRPDLSFLGYCLYGEGRNQYLPATRDEPPDEG
jgi:uncharacterized caspase-like protein